MWVSAPEVERVKGPLKSAEGEGQSAEGDVAVGTRIAQPLGFAGQVRGHFGQQIRFIEVEGVTQFELERAAGGFVAGQAELEDSGGLAVKIGALFDGDENQAGLCGG